MGGSPAVRNSRISCFRRLPPVYRSVTNIALMVATVLWGAALFTVTTAKAETLAEALTAVYQTNPRIVGQRDTLRARDELASQAISNWRPTVTLRDSLSRNFTDSRTDGIGFNQARTGNTASVRVDQPLFRGTRNFAQLEEADLTIQAERAQLVSVEQQVFLNAVTAYMDVIRDQAVLELNINSERVLKEQLDATRARFRAGGVTITDVSQAEARYSNAVAGRIRAENDLRVSKSRYQNIVGRMPGTLEKPALPGNLPASRQSGIEEGMEEHPDVLRAEFAERAAEQTVRRNRGEFFPSISAFGEASRSDDLADSNSRDFRSNNGSVGVEFSMPLYNAGATSSRVRQAKAERSRLQNDLLQERRNAEERVIRAWQNLQSARAQIESFKAEIRANEIAFESVRKEAQEGLRTILDVLDTEQDLFESRVNLVRAERDELVAGYELLAAVGRLTAKNLGLGFAVYDPTRNAESVRHRLWGTGTPDDDRPDRP